MNVFVNSIWMFINPRENVNNSDGNFTLYEIISLFYKNSFRQFNLKRGENMERETDIGEEKKSKASPSSEVEMKRKMKGRWGKLSNEDIDSIQSSQNLLADQLIKTYGFSKSFAKSESESFMSSTQPKRKENLGSGQAAHPRMSGALDKNNTQSDNPAYSDDQP